MKLEVFTCRICAETGRDDYGFCRNCVPLGRHCNDCVARGFCNRLAFFETPDLALTEGMTSRRFDKYTLQTLGFGLVAIGVILLTISIFTGQPESCPANGCVPGVFFWYDVVRGIAFFSSIAFIVLGIILLIVARRMRPAKEIETIAQPSASE